jgi:hypothetical protein
MLVVSVLNAWWDSAIFDETAHIPAGYSYLTQHDMRLNPEHPPLIKDLAELPLLFMNLKFNTSMDFWTKDINGQWDAGRDLLWQERNDANQIIFWSRLPIVILSLILGWFIFKWTRELVGISAGLFALAIYAFDPNILGHNHFVTTDIGIAAFMTFSFYYFLKFIKDPSWTNVFWGGIFLGLVQLVKFSSIMLLPIFGLVLIIYPLVKICRNKNKNIFVFKIKKLAEYLVKGVVAFIISLVAVWGVYAFNDYNMPKEKLAKTINYYFDSADYNKKTIYTNKVLLLLNENRLTRPLSEYALGISMVFKRVSGGNGAYFMGKVSSTAFPAYFPTVFVLKEPLPILFFMLSALIIGIIFYAKSIPKIFFPQYPEEHSKGFIFRFSEFVRHNIIGISLFAFIVLYAYISITGNLNIGFRHLFPILPFAYILVAKVFSEYMEKLTDNGKITWRISLTALLIILITGTVSAYPAYMSYFNPIAGGSKNGYRYVTDSNADWGQDLKRLQLFIDRYNWCDGNGLNSFCKIYDESRGPIEKIHINYFGGADIKYYFGEQAIDWWDSRRPLETGWYALSTNHIMGSIYDRTKKDSESYRWILGVKPVAQVGTSIFIYYLTPENISEIVEK